MAAAFGTRLKTLVSVGSFAMMICAAAPVVAQSAASSDRAISHIRKTPAYQGAVQSLERDHDLFVSEIIKLAEIPAPPFGEAERGVAWRDMLAGHGLADIEIDAEGNVMGLRRGTGGSGGKLVVISAHLDTVFPAGTDVTVKRAGTRLSAPGIGDDSRGLAALLAYVRALDAGKVDTKSDILFLATVGEEGPGDLRGVRYFFSKGKYKDRVSAFFSLDGIDPARITNGAVGSKRYRVTFKGPGGHSFGAFGIVNPMAAMSKAVTDLYEVVPPNNPKTTYAAAVTGGGTSVNSIPDSVFMDFDMRSESAIELAGLEKRFLAIIDKAVAGENTARSTHAGSISADKKRIGDRPAGKTEETATVARLAAAAVRAQGYKPQFSAASTDANIAIGLGIQAMTIGSGGKGDRAHAPDEYIDVEKNESVKGLSVGLLLLIATANTLHD